MKWGIVVLLSFILVLAACDADIRSKPVGEDTLLQDKAQLDACAEVRCEANSECSDGTCECKEGFKDCDGACIADSACCSDTECGENENCINNECDYSCEAVSCISNKECFPKSEGCYCPEGYNWCDLQNSCIPKDHCCGKFDCPRDNVCTRTIKSSRICVKGEQKQCKFIGSVAKDFGMDGKVYTVAAKRFWYDEYVTLQINDQEVNMTPNSTISIGEVEFHLEILKTTGGTCQDKSVDRDEQS